MKGIVGREAEIRELQERYSSDCRPGDGSLIYSETKMKRFPSLAWTVIVIVALTACTHGDDNPAGLKI